MANLTIKEMRENELVNFSTNYNIEINEARTLVNSFYRFCGLEETLLYRENDEKLCNSNYTKTLQNKEERWIKRLQNNLSKYNLKMIWFGYLPTICEDGTTKTALNRYFYE